MSGNSKSIRPKRGEIWYVDMEPTRGVEIRKKRPCVVISSDTAGTLPLRLVVPLTGWQESFAVKFWLVGIEPDAKNGLSKTSSADTLQARGVDFSRFGGDAPIGILSEEDIQRVVAALALLTEYESPAAL